MGLDANGQRSIGILELVRTTDVTGVSGTGVVAYGVEFPDGRVVLRWCTGIDSTVLYDSITDVVHIHGHNGATELITRTVVLLSDHGGNSLAWEPA
jgi:hypothetical protein